MAAASLTLESQNNGAEKMIRFAQGLPMRIHVTEATKAQTASAFQYSENTEIDVKGKGMMKTYFL